jgi:hypothetical protein
MAIRKAGEWLGVNDFTFFFGVVEDIDDPLKIGRVRVRCHSWHTANKALMPTSSLPWAQVLTPATNAAYGNIGETPVGMIVGTTVFGFFADSRIGQMPIIIGTVPGISPTVGEPDMNRLARNDGEYPPELIEKKNQSVTEGVPIARGGSWSEPKTTYAAKYPHNHVEQSRSGHVKEIDDTPGKERIHEYHKSGTFYEIDASGNKVTRIVGDNYEIVAGSDYVNIKGNANITVGGTLNIKASAINIETGSYSLNVAGESKVKYGGEHSVRYEGTKRTFTGADTFSRHNAGTDFACAGDPPRTGKNDCSDVPSV